MSFSFDAYVTAALFDRSGRAGFALGDGTVRFESGETVAAHDGVALSACAHPGGEGLITGGDDGRVVWSRPSGVEELAKVQGRWIEAVAASAESRLMAFAAGRDLQVRDLADPAFDAELGAHAQGALDWLFGANPYDTCMLQGWGHNPPRYEPGFWNAPGGVCNGITSGLADEADIDFRKPEETEPMHSWRWTEQWIPHAAWLFCALCHGLPRP